MAILFLLAQLTCGLTVSTSVTFIPGLAAANTSTLVASPNGVVANGTSTATLTFTALDAYSNLVPGTAVSLSASGGNNTFGAASGITNSKGVFATTLASTYAQSEIVTASFGSGFSVTTIVQFQPGAASSSTSGLVLSPNNQVANNSNTITALLTLKDAQGNAIPNVVPTFAASGNSTTVSSPLATSASGQSFATYQTTLAQSENALVTAGGLSFTAPMVFVAGPPTPGASTIAASPNIAAGNGSAAISLVTTVRDAQGNVVSGASVGLSASGGNNTFAAANGNTTTSGTYTTTLKSTLMQTETVTALVAGNFNETTSVTFTGNANATTSSLAIDPNMQTVGPSNLITATLTLRDAAANPLTGVTPTWTASGGNNAIVNAGATSSSGVGTATYSSTLAQNENVVVTAGGVSFYRPVQFTAGSPNATTSYSYAIPNRQLANNSNVIVVTGVFYDAYNNPFSGQTAAFSSTGVNTTASSTVTTNNVGVAQASYRTGTIQNQNILVSSGGLTLTTPVIFTDIPSQCMLTTNPNSQPANGNNQINVSAVVTNNSNQPVPNVLVVFSSTGAAQTFAAQNVITTRTGQATSTLTSFYAGVNTVLAQAANVQCKSQGTFTAGTPYCSSNPNFKTATYATGAVPGGIVVGDFDGDGKLDLATANHSDNTVGVFINTGTGAFKAQVTFPTGTTPYSLVTGDFDGDGLLDIATSNSGSNTLSFLRNSGAGIFLPSVNFTVGSNPHEAIVGDFNGDGNADLSIVCANDNTVAVLIGTGRGSFQPPVAFATGSAPFGIAVGDFNGDGKQDLVVGNSASSTIGVLLGTGTGSFSPQTTYAAGTNPRRVKVGDFNGDGEQDIVAVNQSGPTISVFIGTGTGTFQTQTTYATGNNPLDLVVSDLNGDGKQDIAVVNGSSATISTYLGTGSGAFQNQVTYPTSTLPWSITAGDLDADGKPDLAIVNENSNSLGTYLTVCP